MNKLQNGFILEVLFGNLLMYFFISFVFVVSQNVSVAVSILLFIMSDHIACVNFSCVTVREKASLELFQVLKEQNDFDPNSYFGYLLKLFTPKFVSSVKMRKINDGFLLV